MNKRLSVSHEEIGEMLSLAYELVDPADVDEAVDFLFRLFYGKAAYGNLETGERSCDDTHDDRPTRPYGEIPTEPSDEPLPYISGGDAGDTLHAEEDS